MKEQESPIASREVVLAGRSWKLLSGIAMPTPHRGRRGRNYRKTRPRSMQKCVPVDLSLPFALMEPGECVCTGEYSMKGMTASLVRANHCRVTVEEGGFFSARKVRTPDGKEWTFVWRTR
jgi:hypothetical protein